MNQENLNQKLYNSLYSKNEDALLAFQKALECDPNQVNAIFNLANVLQVLGKYEDAAKLFEKVAKMNKNDSVALYRLGDCLVHLGNFKEYRFENT